MTEQATAAVAEKKLTEVADTSVASGLLDNVISQTERLRECFLPKSQEQLWKQCQMYAASGMVPNDYRGKPDAIFIAWQMGLNLGITDCITALQNISVINGRPCVWGDMMLALCKGRAAFMEDSHREWWEGEGDKLTAYVSVRRRGGETQTRAFSVTDAKQAKLWGKAGPWQQYPKRMLQMRARAFALRDVFPDLLAGMGMAEEVMDMDDIAEEKRNRRVLDAAVSATAMPAPSKAPEIEVTPGAPALEAAPMPEPEPATPKKAAKAAPKPAPEPEPEPLPEAASADDLFKTVRDSKAMGTPDDARQVLEMIEAGVASGELQDDAYQLVQIWTETAMKQIAACKDPAIVSQFMNLNPLLPAEFAAELKTAGKAQHAKLKG